MNDRKSETENKYQQYLDDTDDGRQSTHYEDCWRAHTRCAIAEAAAAHEQIDKVRAENIALKSLLDAKLKRLDDDDMTNDPPCAI